MNLAQTDIAHFLQPIAADKPAGCDIEYEPIFEQINAARETDDDFLQDDAWGYETRQADWMRVSTLCQEVLEKQSKDLQIACWLTQAQGELYGLAGISGGITLLAHLLETFWPVLYPLLDDTETNSADARLGRLSWLDKQLVKQLDNLTLTDDGKLSLSVWQRVQYFEQRVAVNSELRSALISDGYFGIAECDGSIRTTPVEQFNQLLVRAEQVSQALAELQKIMVELLPDAGNSMSASTQRLQDLVALIERFREMVAPGSSQESSNRNEAIASGEDAPNGMNTTFLTEDRAHHEMRTIAIGQMINIANYFRQNEPTSPVPYLIERAARWANMGMAEWLEEMMSENTSALQEIMRVMKGPETNREQNE
ncbi:type VI secretion system protein TssA [Photorhabdus bodei]|uniref:Type VI secretion system protein TssA n=1 Tax=Photorhabdus bodei TaxID=2029681 RepID=A0ABX0ANE6_9GAMM|nr:type VI secretion system protein TssA [Photorhabdus bodei]NDL02144.1 type VI secretion system protein TssA [Photorhabdus bodei]NDL06218.1 type VI secretion system protein TssA [Photorhabdus bodei]